MSLDSWIDERALDMMRALAPSRGNEPPVKPPAPDFGFDPLPEQDEPLPEAVESARIAPPVEADPAAVQRLRSRLAEIRRRAEIGGVVRSTPARITPSVPVAPPPPVAPVEEIPLPETDLPPEPKQPEPPPPPVEPCEPLASSPSVVENPEPLGQKETAPIPATAPGEIPRGTGLVIPEGPLAVRLDAYRRWLERECGLSNPVVFDRHGCPLHPAEGQSSFIAAAVSLGVAWREACALTDPPGTLRAVHSAWGAGTMAVTPVPTRFGDLYVAGQVGAAIEPERAAEIGAALRRTAGV